MRYDKIMHRGHLFIKTLEREKFTLAESAMVATVLQAHVISEYVRAEMEGKNVEVPKAKKGK